MSRRVPQEARVESTHVHQQVTVAVTCEMTRASRSWVRIHFRNNADDPVTVMSASPFIGVSRNSEHSALPPGAPGHIWPESSTVNGAADEVRLVLKPGEVRSCSLVVHYPLEEVCASRERAAVAHEPIQLDYFLRVETEDARGQRRMSSFRYMTRVIGTRITGALGRVVPASERYPAVVLREA
jgi:hypothetical protein